MDPGCPSRRIKILLESKPLKSRSLGVREVEASRAGADHPLLIDSVLLRRAAPEELGDHAYMRMNACMHA